MLWSRRHRMLLLLLLLLWRITSADSAVGHVMPWPTVSYVTMPTDGSNLRRPADRAPAVDGSRAVKSHIYLKSAGKQKSETCRHLSPFVGCFVFLLLTDVRFGGETGGAGTPTRFRRNWRTATWSGVSAADASSGISVEADHLYNYQDS